MLFCENETNGPSRPKVEDQREPLREGRLSRLQRLGNPGAVNPDKRGTKGAAHYVLVGARRRGHGDPPAGAAVPGDDAVGPSSTRCCAARRAEADAFYASDHPDVAERGPARAIMRQALAGMLWTKQFYAFDVQRWLREHGISPWSAEAAAACATARGSTWSASDIISMPDKWEYPWFAAWDLAFHCALLGLVDLDFAKEQVELLLHTRYLHPNGQIPAYEWNFCDVNPPVHGVGGAVGLQREERDRAARATACSSARVFQRLLTNFTWWVNRKDPDGRNLFAGRLPGAGQHRHLRPLEARCSGGGIAAAGRRHGVDGALLPVDAADRASSSAATRPRAAPSLALQVRRSTSRGSRSRSTRLGDGHDALWDEEDGFFYDVMRLPDGTAIPSEGAVAGGPAADVRGDGVRARGRGAGQPEADGAGHAVRGASFRGLGADGAPTSAARRATRAADAVARRPATSCDADRLKAMLDEGEFLGPHGIRSLSRRHLDQPCRVRLGRCRQLQGPATCRASQTRACSAATRTGAARCGSR